MIGRTVVRVGSSVADWRRRDASVPPLAFGLGRGLQVVLVVVAAAVAVVGGLRPLLGPLGADVGRGPFWGAVPVVETGFASLAGVTTDPPLPALGGGPYGPGEAVEYFPSGLSLQFWTPDLPQRLLLVAVPVLTAALVVAVLVQLVGLCGALAAGDPFSRRSRARLRAVAVLVGVAGQVLAVASAAVRWWVLSDDRLSPWVAPEVLVPWWPAAVGAAVAVAACAVDVGLRTGSATVGPARVP